MPLVIRSPKSGRRDSQLGGSSHFETFRNIYESEWTRRTRRAGSFKLVEDGGLWAVHSGGVSETMFLALAITPQGRPLQELTTLGCERVLCSQRPDRQILPPLSPAPPGTRSETEPRGNSRVPRCCQQVHFLHSAAWPKGHPPNLPPFPPPARQPAQRRSSPSLCVEPAILVANQAGNNHNPHPSPPKGPFPLRPPLEELA
jgi:hypothetical protein